MAVEKLKAVSIKAILKIINFAVSAILISAAAFLVYVAVPYFGNKALIVRSGSMSPAIGVGDLVVVNARKPVAAPAPSIFPKYQVGDIVAFSGQKDTSTITTHRIVDIKAEDGKIQYVTKGDANDSTDSGLVAEDKILGKSAFKIAGLGRIFAFAKTRDGFLALVMLRAILVIIFEVINIIREIGNIRRKKHGSVIANNSTSGNILMRLLVPIVVVIMFFQELCASYAETEVSAGNLIQAAVSFTSPSPIPGSANIVINEIYYRIDQSHRFGSEAESEWAELYNSGGSPADLTGWSLEDNTACDDFPGSPIIPAGGFAIVTTTTEAIFRTIWPATPLGTIFITSPTAVGNGLANNDELMLKNGSCVSGSTVDHVSWGSNNNGLNPSVPSVPADGISIERNPDGTDTNTNADFIQSSPPTPGT